MEVANLLRCRGEEDDEAEVEDRDKHGEDEDEENGKGNDENDKEGKAENEAADIRRGGRGLFLAFCIPRRFVSAIA